MHPAPAEVTPEIEPSPDQSGTQPELLSDFEKSPNLRRRWIIAAAVVGVFLVALITFLALPGRQPNAKLSTSVSPNAAQVLRLKGTTEAIQSRAILAPLLAGQQVHTLTITHLAPGGTRVKKGDLLAEFDRQDQMRDFVDKQAEYQKLVDQVAQERAKESAAQAKDETELKTAEDGLRKAELEIQKKEILSRIDAEKKQEDYEEAKATYDQLRETFDLKRKAAEAAIRSLEIQRDRTQQTMLHAQANAELMQIHAPIDGVVVLNTIWKQGTMGEVQEGDQVRAGVPFLQIVNPLSMQVRVMANQQDFPSLEIGQTAKIRLDAYPDMVFTGRVDQMSPIAEGGNFSNKVRSFVVVISIDGNDPKLMPDLSAAVDVDTAKQATGSNTATSAPVRSAPRSGSL